MKKETVKTRKKEYEKNYFENNKEKIKQRQQAYRNREDVKNRNAEYRKKYRETHRDAIKEYRKIYNQTHKDNTKKYNEPKGFGRNDRINKTDKYLLAGRENRLLRKFNMTSAQFDALLIKQNYMCPVCNKPLVFHLRINDYVNRGEVVSVDHSHAPGGSVRGLIHHKCNTGIGYLGDDAETCYRAYVYLKNTDITQNTYGLYEG